MAAICSFQSFVGGSCGPDRRDRKRVAEIVPLRNCNKDISKHKLTWSIAGVDIEIELILARSKVFKTPENVEDLTICPSHRASLGLGCSWRRGSETCIVPQESSGHSRQDSTKVKCPKSDRGLDKQGSQILISMTGTFFPIGSDKNYFMV